MHQIPWQRLDNNGPGAKTDRKPQAETLFPVPFLLTLISLVCIYGHIYIHIYINSEFAFNIW